MENRTEILKAFLSSSAVCTDTRKIEKGAIYFGLKGENFDGNVYAADALEKGCSYAVVQDEKYVLDDRCFLVSDTLLALQNLALDYRKTLSIPIIGITGTNGKTTTKELLHAVLNSTYHCYATEGNLNNHIGVPLSVLKISSEHEMAIIEMGANKGGDIKELCEICLPTCGLITNVGEAHLEGFGSFENIKKTKKELYDFLQKSDSEMFINEGNSHLMEMARELNNRIGYSLSDKGIIHGEITEPDVNLRFTWNKNGVKSEEVCTQLTGKYNLENAIAAVVVGDHFNVAAESIKSSLEAYKPKNNRSQITNTDRNTLILDAYNANITSTKAALENLAEIQSRELSKYFILGDMLELGEYSINSHQEVMNLTSELGLEGVFVGKEYSSANENSMYTCFDSSSDLKEALGEMALNGKLILIKGSRGIKLEVLEEEL